MEQLLILQRSALALALAGVGIFGLSASSAMAANADAMTVMRAAVAQAKAFNATQAAPKAGAKARRNALASDEDSGTEPETPPAPPADDPEDIIPDEAPADPFAGEAQEVAADQTLEVDNQGKIDGIYRCTYGLGGKEQSAYVSVNGKRDGQSIFVVADVAENSLGVNGWGAGTVRGDGEGGLVFAGTTDTQLPFGFTVSVAADGSVTADGLIGMTFKGEDYLGELTCKSIW